MNKVVHFEVTFKLRFQNFDFFQRNILLIIKSLTTRSFIIAYNLALLANSTAAILS